MAGKHILIQSNVLISHSSPPETALTFRRMNKIFPNSINSKSFSNLFLLKEIFNLRDQQKGMMYADPSLKL